MFFFEKKIYFSFLCDIGPSLAEFRCNTQASMGVDVRPRTTKIRKRRGAEIVSTSGSTSAIFGTKIRRPDLIGDVAASKHAGECLHIRFASLSVLADILLAGGFNRTAVPLNFQDILLSTYHAFFTPKDLLTQIITSCAISLDI